MVIDNEFELGQKVFKVRYFRANYSVTVQGTEYPITRTRLADHLSMVIVPFEVQGIVITKKKFSYKLKLLGEQSIYGFSTDRLFASEQEAQEYIDSDEAKKLLEKVNAELWTNRA